VELTLPAVQSLLHSQQANKKGKYMAYKLLTNLIAPGSIQHMAGEILDLADQKDGNNNPLGESLVKRGVATEVSEQPTHIYGQLATGASKGGKLVNEPELPTPVQQQPVQNVEPVDPKKDNEDLETDTEINKATGPAPTATATTVPEQPTQPADQTPTTAA
jgi:hypothetical protein